MLTVQPIVEGHGEVQAIRQLLQRIGRELMNEPYIEVLQPIRMARGRVLAEDPAPLSGYLELAARNVRHHPKGLVLLLLDADEQPPCVLAPQLTAKIQQAGCGVDVTCVLANQEYETWFVAAAESLSDVLDLEGVTIPERPEESRSSKKWIQDRWAAEGKYQETVDQPSLSAKMDLRLCRERSPSFDKLCRELEKRVG